MAASTAHDIAAPATPLAGGDPSMDDILASIRRILTEDEVSQGEVSRPETGIAADDDDDELTLDETMRVVGGPAPEALAQPQPAPELAQPAVFAALGAGSEAAHALVEPPQQTMTNDEPLDRAPPPRAVQPPAPPTLVAPHAAAQSQAAIASLIQTLQDERLTAISRSGPTLEDLVRVEIRPILKAWLDTHLPPMVERVVRLEIERLTGRGMA